MNNAGKANGFTQEPGFDVRRQQKSRRKEESGRERGSRQRDRAACQEWRNTNKGKERKSGRCCIKDCQSLNLFWHYKGDSVYRDIHPVSLSLWDRLSGRQEIIPLLISNFIICPFVHHASSSALQHVSLAEDSEKETCGHLSPTLFHNRFQLLLVSESGSGWAKRSTQSESHTWK